MLIGIPPLLGPEFLATLRAMGHGDELAVVDGNYPAQEHGRRVLRADGHAFRLRCHRNAHGPRRRARSPQP